MSAAMFLRKENLRPWLASLAKGRRVLVPTAEGDTVLFRPFDGQKDIELSRPAASSPKEAVFPACETLLEYSYIKDPDDPGKTQLDMRETVSCEPSLVFGARPCDVRGLTVFDRVYAGESRPDVYYSRRRENTVFAALTCAKPATGCFCNWTGGDPGEAEGADLLFTPLEDGYLVETRTEQGEALVSGELFVKATKTQAAESEKVKKAAREALGVAPDISEAPKKIAALFDDLEFWEEVSAQCLSCGACTYLCPSCYCFNITDEARGTNGVRLRSWDNCMSFLFTLEGSGHNPRPTKAHRYRNRVGHKFSYYPDLHGELACVGCGRCIRSCPASMDIREVVLKAIERASASPKEAAND